jgi:hypothetical protein
MIPAVHDPGVQIGPHQPDDPTVGDRSAEAVDEDVVVDPVEELLEVNVHHDPSARLHEGLSRKDGGLRASARTAPLDHVATIRARPKASQRGQGLTLGRFPTFPADSKRSENALAVRAERGVQYRLQNLKQGLGHQSIPHRRDAKRARRPLAPGSSPNAPAWAGPPPKGSGRG